jgi:MFS family permease
MDASKRYENTLVAILFFTWGTVFLDRMSLLYLAPYFAPEFHLSHAQIGTLASVLAITWAGSTFFFGALSDRVGRKPVLIPAVFIFSILSWTTGLAHSFHQLFLIRGLMGIPEGRTWSIMTALIEESSDPGRRGRNIGLVVSAAALVDLAAAPVLTTQVASRWGWRPAFFVAGIPGLLMGCLIWKFAKEPARADGDVTHDKPSLKDYLSILRCSNIWLCCLGSTGFMSWLFALNVFARSTSRRSRISLRLPRGSCWAPAVWAVFSLVSSPFAIRSNRTQTGVAADGRDVCGRGSRLPCTRVVCLSSHTGCDSSCEQYGSGHSESHPGAGADRKCSVAISSYLDRSSLASDAGR